MCREGEYKLMSTKMFINDKLGAFIEIKGETSKDRYAIIVERDYRIQFML